MAPAPVRSPIPLATPAAVARNLLEARAMQAHEIHAYRIGYQPGWANLTEHQRQAWREVVQWFDSIEPQCSECHQPIWCRKCRGRE
jgi:hypothetical protein